MAKIFYFTPRKEFSARDNLREFISLSKNHIRLWSDLEGFTWEGMRWPITSKRAIRFLNHENTSLHHSANPQPQQLMQPPFIDVAKAYIRYRHSIDPHKNIGREISAFRALEFVLRRKMGDPDIVKVTQSDFNEAISVMKCFESAPFVAAELLRILQNLSDFFIVTGSAHYWTHPYVGRRSYDYKNGAYASQEAKNSKVANQDALLAIGDVFGRGYTQVLEDVDVMVTSITAILLSAPMRIGEIIRLRTDCLGCDTDKDGKLQYFLKYWVPKTQEFARKPIPEVMAESAIEAINRLKDITAEARQLARYMETGPTKFYRHANCPKVPDNQELTRDQVAQALGFAHRKSAENFIKRHTGRRALKGFTLDSLWQIILSEHHESNPDFPYQEPQGNYENVPPKMSEALLCARRFQFGTRSNSSPVLLAPFDQNYYTKRLDATIKTGRKNDRPLCFFARHGFEPIKVKSHGIRHLINKLAKQSGVSTEVITAWSSRSSYHQTLTYLDNDKGESAAKAASMMGISQEKSTKPPIYDQEAELYGQGPLHRSRYGLCLRSWRVGPCNKFGDCLNCSELLMCKGDKLASSVIEIDRTNLIKTYNAAQEAIKRGERSASRWTENAASQIDRLNQLLAIFNNPTIPDDTPVQCDGTNFSHEQTLIEEKTNAAGIKLLDRKKLSIEYGSELLECLGQLRKPRNV